MTKKFKVTTDTWGKFDSTSQSYDIPQSKRIFLEQGAVIEVSDRILEAANNHLECWVKVNLFKGHLEKIVPEKINLNWYDFNSPISKYFTVGEATQYDEARIPKNKQIQDNILRMALELDKIREAWGSAIAVTSWYRPPLVNRRVGGASRSQHLTGAAVDIYPVNGKIYEFQKWLDTGLWKDRALGYGAKKGYVHIDLRQGRIRWNY